MLLTIEKVVLLKSVNIFSQMPDYALAFVASIIEEVEVLKGETFIKKGDMEDCMYIIAEGSVKVHVENRIIAKFGKGETVGEMAVLDPETRSAYVTALEDTLLFRLNKEDFDEVMVDHPEIFKGIIRMLCQRLRVTTKKEYKKD